jgi:Protein of unknown function (DUF2778)
MDCKPHIYEQATGILLSPSGEVLGKGYSGFGEGKNKPDAQAESNVGPLPRGLYTIAEPHDDAHVGPYAMRLTPLTDTNTFGRSDFLIHGDSVQHPGQASHGCIIMPRSVREAIWASDSHTIEVVHG